MRPVPEPQLNHILHARFGGQYDAREPFIGGRFNEIRRVCRTDDDNLVPEPSRRPSDIQEHDFAPAYIAVIGG